jgi:hypothetical protein
MAKKKKQRNKTRNVNKSPYKNIERMWADKGVINILKKDGSTNVLTVGEAAARAVQINAMPTFNENERKHRLFFVENIISLCREAKSQLEDRSDKATQDLHNMLDGKLPDGTPVSDSKFLTYDVQIQQFLFKYTTLSEKEVITVVENKDYTVDQKDFILQRIHAQRMAEEASRPIPE